MTKKKKRKRKKMKKRNKRRRKRRVGESLEELVGFLFHFHPPPHEMKTRRQSLQDPSGRGDIAQQQQQERRRRKPHDSSP